MSEFHVISKTPETKLHKDTAKGLKLPIPFMSIDTNFI